MLDNVFSKFVISSFIIFEGLPGHREVEVKYVDFGNTAKITLKDMRKIKDEFLNPAEKVIYLLWIIGLECQYKHESIFEVIFTIEMFF